MTLYKNKYRVETTRLASWNYNVDGYYFVTICTVQRRFFFGKILDKEMALSDIGVIAREEFAWQARFWDRVIRDEHELNTLREYIVNNPVKWELDRENKEGPWTQEVRRECLWRRTGGASPPQISIRDFNVDAVVHFLIWPACGGCSR